MNKSRVTIEKMSFGGDGFGHVDGKACFIPFTSPGDVVSMRILEEKSSFIRGVVQEVVDSSSLRVNPPCPIFGTCGGCQWQHISYAAQCAEKHQIFAGIMARIGRVDTSCIETVVTAHQDYGYRSRVQLKVRQAGGEVHVGFYRGGSHFVVTIPGSCPISAPKVNSLIAELQRLMGHFPEPDKIPQIDISTGDDDNSLVIFHYIGTNRDAVCRFLSQVTHEDLSADGVWLQAGRKNTLHRINGIDGISYRVPGVTGELELSVGAGGFSQVNFPQNRILVQTVIEWSELTGNEKILDLYCGNGNVSLPLAKQAAEVVGMEEYEPSLRDATENSRRNDIKNATFECIDVAAGVKNFISSGEFFDLVILDPPRAGAKDAAPLIGSLRPRAIIYISCDPPTLARDVALLRKQGYELVKSRPLDMFPQTYHLESVNLLKPVSPERKA